LDAANTKSYPGTGTGWFDLSGSNIIGTLTNGPTYNSDNLGNISFDATDDYVVSSSTTFTANVDFTYEIMLKSSEFLSARGIFTNKGYWSGGGQGASISNISSPQTIYGYVTTNTGHFDINSSVGPTYGWTHVIMRRFNNDLRFFINGKHQGTTRTISGSVTDLSDKFWLGSHNLGSSPWKGNIAFARVYNKALSTEEIQQNFNALRGRFGI
jgi:hypothetical protein